VKWKGLGRQGSHLAKLRSAYEFLPTILLVASIADLTQNIYPIDRKRLRPLIGARSGRDRESSNASRGAIAQRISLRHHLFPKNAVLGGSALMRMRAFH
jgi:hypothetical protein